jgi:hypothetical protein
MKEAVFDHIKRELTLLSRKIDDSDIKDLRAGRDWGGADVVISPVSLEKASSGGFYPAPRTVVTQFSREVSWLFEQLRDIFSGLLESDSKIEFYGRLANAAKNYQQRVNGGENAKDILRAVLYEAVVMLEEMEEGTFEYLSVGVGNTILADLVMEAEKSGYIGVEATKEFFKRMEEKHL